MKGPDPIQQYDFRQHKDVHDLTAEAVDAQSYIWRDMQRGTTFLQASMNEEMRYIRATHKLKVPWWKRMMGGTR